MSRAIWSRKKRTIQRYWNEESIIEKTKDNTTEKREETKSKAEQEQNQKERIKSTQEKSAVFTSILINISNNFSPTQEIRLQ